jgi:hypothetical protein
MSIAPSCPSMLRDDDLTTAIRAPATALAAGTGARIAVVIGTVEG